MTVIVAVSTCSGLTGTEKYQKMKFGDWELHIITDAFGETNAILSHDPTRQTSMQISCNDSAGFYSMHVRHPDPIGWNTHIIPVKYKVGNSGDVVTEIWAHDYSHDMTYKVDATELVNAMMPASGNLVFRVLTTDFTPSLKGFTKAINELDKYCKH